MNDLEKRFATTPKQEKLTYQPHRLKQFFEIRRISNTKIAEELNVHKVQIGYWLTGQRVPPKKWEAELDLLEQRFLDWEAEHGYMFNSRPIDINPNPVTVNTVKKPPTSKKPICPYSKEFKVTFGRDFDEYSECADCDLRVECEKEKANQTQV
jgi:hypothetical protein